MEIKIELRQHPAQAQHPVTKKPLFDEHNDPVPLFPKQKSIWMLGDDETPDVLIGYVSEPPALNVNIIKPPKFFGSAEILENIREQIGQKIGTDGHGGQAINEPENTEADEEDDE